MYNTNLASIQNARSYFEGSASVLPYDQRDGTADALNQLGVILQQIVVGTYPGQNTSAGNASATEATQVNVLSTIVEDVVRANTLEILPTETAVDETGASSTRIASRDLIQATGDSSSADLVQGVIDYINTNQNGFKIGRAHV